MDYLSHKAYKCLKIKGWNAKIIYKNGLENPERAFIWPQLFNRKLLIFIFFISSNLENINNGFIILGAIDN